MSVEISDLWNSGPKTICGIQFVSGNEYSPAMCKRIALLRLRLWPSWCGICEIDGKLITSFSLSLTHYQNPTIQIPSSRQTDWVPCMTVYQAKLGIRGWEWSLKWLNALFKINSSGWRSLGICIRWPKGSIWTHSVNELSARLASNFNQSVLALWWFRTAFFEW